MIGGFIAYIGARMVASVYILKIRAYLIKVSKLSVCIDYAL